jgi:hypothetical protein
VVTRVPLLDLVDVILSDLVRPTRMKLVILLMTVLFVTAVWPDYLWELVVGALCFATIVVLVKVLGRTR